MGSLLGNKNGQTLERAMIKDYLMVGIYAIALVALIAAIGFYTYYIWSDCLGENGFLTCARMLNK